MFYDFCSGRSDFYPSLIAFLSQHCSDCVVYYDNDEPDDDVNGWKLDPPEAGSIPISKSAKSHIPLFPIVNLVTEAELYEAYRAWLIKELVRSFPQVNLEYWRSATEQFIKAYGRSCSLWRSIAFILADVEESIALSCDFIVASHAYWPPLEPSNKLSLSFEVEFEKLSHSFSHRYPDGRKRLLPGPFAHGILHLCLEWPDGTLTELECTPAQHHLLINLENSDLSLYSADDISDLLAKGVVSPGPNGLQLSQPNGKVLDAKLWQPSSAPTQVQEDDDSFSTYFPFIKAMLTNLGALPLDRIHGMLGMFAPDYKEPISSLGKYLTSLFERREVSLSDGLYSLPK